MMQLSGLAAEPTESGKQKDVKPINMVVNQPDASRAVVT